MTKQLNIGLFAIGLDTYWAQFSGLEERLLNYLQIIENQLKEIHPYTINAGLVDSIDKAFEAGSFFRRNEVDIIFLYVAIMLYLQLFYPLCNTQKSLLLF